jgi:hypothetical protein
MGMAASAKRVVPTRLESVMAPIYRRAALSIMTALFKLTQGAMIIPKCVANTNENMLAPWDKTDRLRNNVANVHNSLKEGKDAYPFWRRLVDGHNNAHITPTRHNFPVSFLSSFFPAQFLC